MFADPPAGLALVVLLVMVGVLVTAWVFAPLLRGREGARQYLGSYRLAAGSVVAVLTINLVLAAPIIPLFGSVERGFSLSNFLFSALSTQGVMLLVVYTRAVAPGALSWRELGLRPIPLGRTVALGVGIGLVGLLLTAVIGLILAGFGVRHNQLEQFQFVAEVRGPTLALVFLAGAVVAPFVEEIFFRGFLFGTLLRRKPLVAAYVVPNLLFALLHGLPRAMDPGQMVGLWVAVFALGVLLSWSYRRTGSLFPSMVAHGFNNGLVLLVLSAGMAAS